MALVTVQRSPSPSASAETDELDTGLDTTDGSLKSPRNRRRKSRSALKKLKKLFNTVRFVTKLKPCFSENYFTVKGAALILPQSDYETAFTRKATKSHGGDIQSHLQSMFSLLRPLDTIKVAVKLEGAHDRYLALVSCIGKQDTEESVVLGMDLQQDATTIGLIMPVWAHTYIKLDGDGGFSITSNKETRFFKPVSVQAMWSALQSLNKCLKIANDNLYIPGGLTHTWIGFYDSKRSTDYQIVSEWNATSDIDKSYRTDTTATDTSDEASLYKRIKTELKLVMMSVDLEEVTCKFLRESLEKTLDMNLKDYRSFIDTEMFEILGQMDAPSQIQDYLYLGSEWNASNIEELQKNGVHYILNVSREIDNFYPGILHYMNVREWDTEQADLMKHWEDTHRFISKARKKNGKVLVHCKMGISRSASTVIAHLMKENRWSRDQAFEFTKEKRSIINPNSGFWKQLETYEGILNARRKYIENVNNPVSSGLVQTDETEEHIDLETAFPRSAEDLLAMKLGKDPEEFGDYQHIFNTEQDIELSSRSADSTEESFPDERSPQPADESAQGATGGAFLYPRKKKDKSSSGDYLETDSSDDTESEELSDSDDEDNSNAFRPIEVPKIDIQKTGKSKGRRKHDVKKVEARRCKSESDKHMLSVDNKSSGMSRDGSVSKFKPDESWIKLHQSDEELEQQVPEPMDVDQDRESIAGVKQDEGLWMGEIKVASEESDKNDNKQAPAVAGNVDDTKKGAESDSLQGDTSIRKDMKDAKSAITDKEQEISGDKKRTRSEGEEPVKVTSAKESIPVASGLVQKQKQDFEGKFKSAGHTKTASLGSTDLQILCKSEKVRKDSETASVTSIEQETKMDTSIVDTKMGESKDIRTESAMEVDPTVDDSKSDISEDSTQKPKMRSRLSVYDLEEIDLPEDYVKRTKQQIENRLSVETPRRRIQRSSSLKSRRVTPKAKDRDNERRKTCIAVLSPTSSDNSARDEIKSPDQGAEPGEESSGATEGKFSLDQSDVEDFLVKSTGDAEGGEEEKMDETGMVKVYKYMGEELTVQEGLVKKQTLGIEQKATGAPCSRPSSRLDTEMEHSGRSSESPSISSTTSEHSDKTRETDASSVQSISSSGVSRESSTDKKVKTLAKESGLSLGAKLSENAKSTSHETGHSEVLSGPISDAKAISEYKVEPKDLEVGEEIDKTTATEPAKTFDSIRANFQDKDDPAGSSGTTTPAKKWGTRKTSSRFDAETLELIREIGSALMNSPAKVEVEETDAAFSGRGLVKNFVRNIEKEVWVNRKKKAAREIIIVDKDTASENTETASAKSSPVKPLQTKSCDSKSEITSVPSPKWSPVSKTPPASNSPVAKKTSSPSSITSSPETVQTHRNSPVAKHDMVQKPDASNLSLNLKSDGSPKAELAERHNKQSDKESDSEPCSVKNLRGKFETPSGKTTPVSMIFGCIGSPSASYPSVFGASNDFEMIDKKDGASVKSETTKTTPDIANDHCLSPKAETKGSFHDCGSQSVSPKPTKPRSMSDIPSYSAFSKPSQSPGSSRKIIHRQSEPDIRLSERNIHLLDTKLREVGAGLIPSACIIESEEEDTDLVQDSTVPSFLPRSRSEDQGARTKERKERRARMIGAKSKTKSLGHSEALSESEAQDSRMFTWEGKKIRKNYGKSHPLAKLEGTYKGSIRSTPFYSTM